MSLIQENMKSPAMIMTRPEIDFYHQVRYYRVYYFTVIITQTRIVELRSGPTDTIVTGVSTSSSMR